MQKEHEEESYLAFATIMGGGSWFQDETADKAAKGLGRTIVENWGSLYDLEGHECPIGIYRVDGRHVVMSHRGVFDKKTDEEIPMLEERTIILPKRRRRA